MPAQSATTPTSAIAGRLLAACGRGSVDRPDVPAVCGSGVVVWGAGAGVVDASGVGCCGAGVGCCGAGVACWGSGGAAGCAAGSLFSLPGVTRDTVLLPSAPRSFEFVSVAITGAPDARAICIA